MVMRKNPSHGSASAKPTPKTKPRAHNKTQKPEPKKRKQHPSKHGRSRDASVKVARKYSKSEKVSVTKKPTRKSADSAPHINVRADDTHRSALTLNPTTTQFDHYRAAIQQSESYICVCVCVCVYVYVCVCMYVYMYVYVCIHVCIMLYADVSGPP